MSGLRLGVVISVHGLPQDGNDRDRAPGSRSCPAEGAARYDLALDKLGIHNFQRRLHVFVET